MQRPGLSQSAIMVYVRPDIEAGTIQDQADVPAPPLPSHEADETDEEPDVEDIEVDCQVTSDDFLGFLSGNFGKYSRTFWNKLGNMD